VRAKDFGDAKGLVFLEMCCCSKQGLMRWALPHWPKGLFSLFLS